MKALLYQLVTEICYDSFSPYYQNDPVSPNNSFPPREHRSVTCNPLFQFQIYLQDRMMELILIAICQKAIANLLLVVLRQVGYFDCR